MNVITSLMFKLLYVLILIEEVTLSGAKKRTLRVPAVNRPQFYRAVQILEQRISERIRIHFDFPQTYLCHSFFIAYRLR
jgi:hypothetical protein